MDAHVIFHKTQFIDERSFLLFLKTEKVTDVDVVDIGVQIKSCNSIE